MHIQDRVSLRALNTFGIEQQTRYFANIEHESDLFELSEFIESHNIPLLILGGGSNIVLSQDYPGLVAKINLTGIEFSPDQNQQNLIRAAAGENWHQLVMHSIQHGWQGLENLALIPGSVGAAPMQNIGAYGLELAERFHSLRAYEISTGKIKSFDKTQCQFSYRDSVFKSSVAGEFIITEVTLALPTEPDWRIDYSGIKDGMGNAPPSSKSIADAVIALRQEKLPNPNVIGNVGSFFKNPVLDKNQIETLTRKHPEIPVYNYDSTRSKISAGWLIEHAKLKGFREGDAGVSEQHALVIVNYGNAQGSHILAIAEHVRDTVHEKFGIKLEPEPIIV